MLSKQPILCWPFEFPSLAGLVFLSLAVCVSAEDMQTITNTIGTPAFELRATAQVDGEGIFLNQVIATPRDLPQLRLCDAPLFGKSAILKQSEVAELARAAGFNETLTNWSGPALTRISRRARQLSEKETLQLLTSVLQRQCVKEQGELELRFARPWNPINTPDEPFVIKVLDLPTSGVSSSFILRFEVETAHGEAVGSWQASLQAKVWREIWVASSAVKRGESVVSAGLARERRDMLLCHEPLAEFAQDDQSLEFAEAVQTGAPICARLVRARAIVHRGQSVAARVQDGALLITLKVEALEDGAAGQIIRVRNPLSRRDLRGKILDEQNILVFL